MLILGLGSLYEHFIKRLSYVLSEVPRLFSQPPHGKKVGNVIKVTSSNNDFDLPIVLEITLV